MNLRLNTLKFIMVCLKTVWLHVFQTCPVDFSHQQIHPRVIPATIAPIPVDFMHILWDSRHPCPSADLYCRLQCHV